MPSQTINAIAKACGYDLSRVESWWEKAKAHVKNSGCSENDQDFWPRVVTLVKKRAGEACVKKLKWTSPVRLPSKKRRKYRRKHEDFALSRAGELIFDTLLADFVRKEYNMREGTFG
jgi:hypothetical protein